MQERCKNFTIHCTTVTPWQCHLETLWQGYDICCFFSLALAGFKHWSKEYKGSFPNGQGTLIPLSIPLLWLTVLSSDWPSLCLVGWLTDRLSVWLTNWLTDRLSVCLTDRLSVWLTDWLTVWLTDWLTDQLTDWLTDLDWLLAKRFHRTWVHPP